MNLNKYNLRISWAAIGFFFALSTVAVPLALARPNLLWQTFFNQFSIGLVISTLTSILLTSLFFIGNLSNVKHIFLWMTVLILIGIVRGSLIRLFVDLFGLTDPASFLLRIINSVVNTVFWVTVFSMLIESSRKFRSDYQGQLRILIRKMEEVEDLHRSDVKFLEKQVGHLNSLAKSSLESRELDDAQAEKLRNSLIVQIDQVLKPMSYKLWKHDSLAIPRVKFLHAALLTVRNLEFSYFKVFWSITIIGFINGLSIFGAYLSLFRLLIYLGIWSVVHLIFKRSRKSNKRAEWNVLYLVASGICPMLFSELISQAAGFDSNLRSAILFMPVLPIIIFVFAFEDLISSERDKLIQKLQELTGSNLRDAYQLSIKRAELGGYLHNSLQSELLAMSMQLERARNVGDFNSVKSIIERLHSFLTNVLKSDFSEQQMQLGDRLERIRDGWEGISTITFEFEDLSRLTHSDEIKLVQICEEIITNSVRQGGASMVQIHGAITDHRLNIEIKSDGVLQSNSQDNKEFSWLSYLLEDTWKLESSDGFIKGKGSFSLN